MIPEPLRGEEPGTFANYTVVKRLPDIARRVLAENELHPQAESAMQDLIGELPHSSIRGLTDQSAPDKLDWDSYLTPLLGMDWLQIPWFTAETYFYRRILQATGYFEPGPGYQLDPYLRQKQAGLESNPQAVETLSALVNQHSHVGRWDEDLFVSLLMADLWGNQSDLSIWPAERTDKPDHADPLQALTHLIVDDAKTCASYLYGFKRAAPRIDILTDNAGFELAGDLALADYLLSCGMARTVRFHLKAHPTFVSDAMAKDVRQAIDFWARNPAEAVSVFGQRLNEALKNERLLLEESYFWNSPLAAWEMPEALRSELSSSSLAISKGDAHYRRILGDRHWPYTMPISEIVEYFPCPLLALRTLKSEVAAGLPAGRAEELAREDPSWLTDGRWGLIQFWSGKEKTSS